jgi:hypothetical protein
MAEDFPGSNPDTPRTDFAALERQGFVYLGLSSAAYRDGDPELGHRLAEHGFGLIEQVEDHEVRLSLEEAWTRFQEMLLSQAASTQLLRKSQGAGTLEAVLTGLHRMLAVDESALVAGGHQADNTGKITYRTHVQDGLEYVEIHNSRRREVRVEVVRSTR